MSLDASTARPPQAVLFDAYGTLFDVYSVGALAETLFPGHGERLAIGWRDKQIEYTRLTSMSGGHGEHYRPFWDLTRGALRFTAQRLGLALSDEAEATLLAQYRQLQAFDESRPVLEALHARGIRAGILSNGDPSMLADLIEHAGLQRLIDPVLSVHETRRFKTDPAAYALGPAALGLPVGQIVFVSSNGWDAIGATWYGYRTLWVNRAGLPMEQLDTEPTRVGSSLHDVLAFFDT